MNDTQSLRHTRWDCKYHLVWIPKYCRKTLYGQVRQYLGEVLRELARQKECQVLEGHLLRDHVHMLASIPPKYSVAQVVGFMKGKSAVYIAGNYLPCGPVALDAMLQFYGYATPLVLHWQWFFMYQRQGGTGM